MEPEVRVLGIRHHGPGSARAVLGALAQQQPEVVLIEGPPEADALVRFGAGAFHGSARCDDAGQPGPGMRAGQRLRVHPPGPDWCWAAIPTTEPVPQ